MIAVSVTRVFTKEIAFTGSLLVLFGLLTATVAFDRSAPLLYVGGTALVGVGVLLLLWVFAPYD